MRRYVLVLFALSLIGCKSYESRTKDVGLMTESGRAYMLYEESNRIVVKECPKYTVIDEDTKVCEGGMVKFKVSIDVFRAGFVNAAAGTAVFSSLNHDRTQIEKYAKAAVFEKSYEKTIAELEQKVAAIDRFMKANSESAELKNDLETNSKMLADLKTDLERYKGSAAKEAQFREKFNKTLAGLVQIVKRIADKIVNSSKISVLSYADLNNTRRDTGEHVADSFLVEEFIKYMESDELIQWNGSTISKNLLAYCRTVKDKFTTCNYNQLLGKQVPMHQVLTCTLKDPKPNENAVSCCVAGAIGSKLGHCG